MKKQSATLARNCMSCVVRGPHCFCNLTSGALQDLQDIGTPLGIDAGEMVVREGFSADRVFVVCSGRIKLTTSSSDGRLLILRIAGPGDVLGLVAALKDATHKVAAQALEPCVVKAIGRTEFIEFMERFRDVSRNTVMSVAWEYEEAMLSARRLALSNSAAGKLAGTLLQFGRMGVAEEKQALVFRMPLTHEELGNLAGLSRETVTRLLGRFRREGLLEQEGDQMVVPEPEKMERLFC